MDSGSYLQPKFVSIFYFFELAVFEKCVASPPSCKPTYTIIDRLCARTMHKRLCLFFFGERSGNQQAVNLLIRGLQRLEYRGYDSAGVGILVPDGKNKQGNDIYKISVVKTKGKVNNLVERVKSENLSGTVGIAHTRWATHGAPNDVNAHPHLSEDGMVAVVHNGIVENHHSLKVALQNEGYVVYSFKFNHAVFTCNNECVCVVRIQVYFQESN